jgi:hypothetical protein
VEQTCRFSDFYTNPLKTILAKIGKKEVPCPSKLATGYAIQVRTYIVSSSWCHLLEDWGFLKFRDDS